MRFLDTNIIIRAITKDDPIKGHACEQLFLRVKHGHEQLKTTESVIAEAVYVLASSKWYNLPRAEIVARLRPIVTLRGVALPRKRVIVQALLLYHQYSRLDFEDALMVAVMHHNAVQELVSYDTDFDTVAGIIRQEP